MSAPTVDIIVPVWNSPFETRACLAAVLTHSPQARLIIVASGSDRSTELMLEEFSEPLEDRGLFITCQRNLGLVRAINMGLARSDSDYAIILRPHVLVSANWLEGLLEAAQGGLASPRFRGTGTPRLPAVTRGCSQVETCSLSFSALAVKGEVHMLLGGFDEQLDGAEWCLRDYQRRAGSRGYRTCVTTRTTVECSNDPLLGSEERRRETAECSRSTYGQRWGLPRHYAVYFGHSDTGSLAEAMDAILDSARCGHRFSLLLHHRQFSEFCRLGWNGLHTGITLQRLSLLAPQRDLQRSLARLQVETPNLLLVQGGETPLPGDISGLSLADLTTAPSTEASA